MLQHLEVRNPREVSSPRIVESRSLDQNHREGRIVGHHEVVAGLEPSRNG